ncbi:hypothetical protein B0H13DRAFT_1866143 [Mycena leptocephala]|nr:hypothetical protein B0H13DRAFT_1866143 [Mycena leptocephala]
MDIADAAAHIGADMASVVPGRDEGNLGDGRGNRVIEGSIVGGDHHVHPPCNPHFPASRVKLDRGHGYRGQDRVEDLLDCPDWGECVAMRAEELDETGGIGKGVEDGGCGLEGEALNDPHESVEGLGIQSDIQNNHLAWVYSFASYIRREVNQHSMTKVASVASLGEGHPTVRLLVITSPISAKFKLRTRVVVIYRSSRWSLTYSLYLELEKGKPQCNIDSSFNSINSGFKQDKPSIFNIIAVV